MQRFVAVLLVIIFVSVLLISFFTVVHGQTPTVAVGEEFTLPIPNGAANDWLAFTGVGHSLRYPLAWKALPYQTQGGIRAGAMFQFLWTDPLGLVAQIEALEIVDASDGTAVLKTELAYWQQTAPRNYQVEAVTVQGYPGWWIHAAQPLDTLGLMGVLWTNWGDRVYRFRLTCRPAACMESEQQLRQMLSTLQVATVDWNRASVPLPTSSQNTSGRAVVVPNSTSVVNYNRGAAFAYANSWWNVTNNSDGCYLWYSSVLGCVKDPGDYGVDGAHFINRAVYAGGRPIPGLWDDAAKDVASLSNYLQADGWTETPVAQAALGDVAIMGPFTNPCWTGLVVKTGADPTLATHSGEFWASANSMYCYVNGNPTYVKTYLHAHVGVIMYLPLVLKNDHP